MPEPAQIRPYVLGIDLGAHSLGWAVLPLDPGGNPCGIERVGVRTFEAGVEASYDEMMRGKQKSKAANRRSKRGPRRQFWRRAWRRYKVMKCLIAHGLLRDPGQLDIRKPAEQDRFIKDIDDELRKRLRPAKDDPRRQLWEQVWPYELRASALARKLDPLELGRAFYHLAQRRGFLSNRKTDAPDAEEDQPKKPRKRKKDTAREAANPVDRAEQDGKDDPKKVKAAIDKLSQDMQAARVRTLGEFFARHVNPEERRIRQRWTSRAMYQTEFDAICDAQSAYYPGLAEKGDFRSELHDAIFFQRPLKPCGHLVGHCDLEPDRKRALQAIPLAQEFRLLQKLNDLTVLEPGKNQHRSLTPPEREDLLDALSTQGEMTFKEIRKLLKFVEPKVNKETEEIEQIGHQFRHEAGGEEKLPGDRTASKILACEKKASGIAQRWHDMSDGREELVLALVNFENNEALAENLIERFDFSPDQATALSKIRLEESRCSLSRRAMERLLPLMRRGIHFKSAEKEVYGSAVERRTAVLDFLPRLLATDQEHVPLTADRPAFKKRRDLPNPAVARALAELRKVVNAIIRRHKKKPTRIHVELAREAKKTPLRREIAWKNNRLRQDERVAAENAIKMCKEIGISEPRPDDILKWLLAVECNWTCPYTGEKSGTITPKSLFSSPQFDIEHIVPLSLSRDNSFDNLTLCDAEYNRNIKRKQIPYAVESGNAERWQQILERVKRFKRQKRAVRNPNRKAKNRVIVEDRPNSKHERFAWTPEQVKEFYGDEFTPRQLTDAQYASKLAAEYLGMLYGGVIDETGKRRVQVSSGAVTATLRAEWNLNGVIPSLPDSPSHKALGDIRRDEKLRTDHRHHAIDAIVIALSSPKAVKELSDAARKVEQAELRRQDIRDSQGKRRTRYAEMDPPWGTKESFATHIRSAIAEITISRRPEHKIQGPFHAETNYSREINQNGVTTRRQRIKVTDLSARDIEGDAIADPTVRKAIRDKWRELGGGEPKKVFAIAENHPRLPARPGRQSPTIHTVRINVSVSPITVGHGSRQRFVVSGKDTLHHTLIVEVKDRRGRPVWKDRPVDRLTTHRRLARKRPIVRSKWRHGVTFIMALCKDDCIEMDDGTGGRAVYVVKAISKRDIKVRLHLDARTDEQIAAAGQRQQFRISSPDNLRTRHACRVVVDPLGNVARVKHGSV